MTYSSHKQHILVNSRLLFVFYKNEYLINVENGGAYSHSYNKCKLQDMFNYYPVLHSSVLKWQFSKAEYFHTSIILYLVSISIKYKMLISSWIKPIYMHTSMFQSGVSRHGLTKVGVLLPSKTNHKLYVGKYIYTCIQYSPVRFSENSGT